MIKNYDAHKLTSPYYALLCVLFYKELNSKKIDKS